MHGTRNWALESPMPSVNGGLTRQTRALARLPDEERVFLACVEDILQAAPGLNYTRDVEPPSPSRNGRPFATLTIETNPLCNLTCSLELGAKALAIVINGRRFDRKRGPAIPYEWWVERRCRDVMALAEGDLRIEINSTLAQVTACRLSAGGDHKWRVLGTYDNGWISALGYLLPFGVMMLSREHTNQYSDWFDVS